MESLRCRHVNSIGQGSNDESWTVAQILVTIIEDSIGNLEDVITNEAIPIGLELRLPLKLFRICNSLITQLFDDITGMGVHGDHAHDLLTHTASKLTLHHLNKICQQIYLLLQAFIHCIFLESVFNSLAPVYQVDE